MKTVPVRVDEALQPPPPPKATQRQVQEKKITAQTEPGIFMNHSISFIHWTNYHSCATSTLWIFNISTDELSSALVIVSIAAPGDRSPVCRGKELQLPSGFIHRPDSIVWLYRHYTVLRSTFHVSGCLELRGSNPIKRKEEASYFSVHLIILCKIKCWDLTITAWSYMSGIRLHFHINFDEELMNEFILF